MAFSDLPVLGMLKYKMKWHQARQGVLAQNIANADTPHYKPQDVKRGDFSSFMSGTAKMSSGIGVANTQPMHIAIPAISFGSSPQGFEAESSADWEITPDRNGVTLEDQMIKVTENQMEYQAATTLYSRSLGLLRLAVGPN